MENYNPKDLRYCTGCESVASSCLECNYQTILGRPEARLLRENVGVRFSAFAWEDTERFKHYLGDDMDPVKHGYHQALEVALPFIEFQNAFDDYPSFTEEEAKMLMLANVFHDVHEGVSGDVPEPEKTLQSNIAELELNLRITASILGEDVNSPFMQRYRSVMGDFEGWSLAGRAFAAIERCGYFQSGINAWSLRNHSELDDEEKLKCREMGHAVLNKNTPILTELGKEFPYCWWLLKTNEATLGQVL